MTSQELMDKKIKERIEEFHWYIEEIGLEKAKELILKSTVYNKVKQYVNNYKGAENA